MASLILPRRSLVMVGGVPGSGKSFLLDHVRVRQQTMVMSADEMRVMVQKGRGIPANVYAEECIKEARFEFFEALHDAYAGEESIVVEAAYLSRRSRYEMIDWCERHGYVAHLILVTATWEQCRDGNRARDRRVPADKMEFYWGLYKTLKGELLDGKVDEGLASAYLTDRDAPLDEIIFSL